MQRQMMMEEEAMILEVKVTNLSIREGLIDGSQMILKIKAKSPRVLLHLSLLLSRNCIISLTTASDRQVHLFKYEICLSDDDTSIHLDVKYSRIIKPIKNNSKGMHQKCGDTLFLMGNNFFLRLRVLLLVGVKEDHKQNKFAPQS